MIKKGSKFDWESLGGTNDWEIHNRDGHGENMETKY